jgi:hypothetical protein
MVANPHAKESIALNSSFLHSVLKKDELFDFKPIALWRHL